MNKTNIRLFCPHLTALFRGKIRKSLGSQYCAWSASSFPNMFECFAYLQNIYIYIVYVHIIAYTCISILSIIRIRLHLLRFVWKCMNLLLKFISFSFISKRCLFFPIQCYKRTICIRILIDIIEFKGFLYGYWFLYYWIHLHVLQRHFVLSTEFAFHNFEK